MLRHVTSTLTAFALASTVNAVAQTPAPEQGEKQQAPKETLTGCVMEAKTTDGGTAYVLNNAEGGSAKMYVLVGSSQSDWAKNANKKVEVTGQVQQPNAPPDEDSSAGTSRLALIGSPPRRGGVERLGSCGLQPGRDT
jgi:hypothetical protein